MIESLEMENTWKSKINRLEMFVSQINRGKCLKNPEMLRKRNEKLQNVSKRENSLKGAYCYYKIYLFYLGISIGICVCVSVNYFSMYWWLDFAYEWDVFLVFINISKHRSSTFHHSKCVFSTQFLPFVLVLYLASILFLQLLLFMRRRNFVYFLSVHNWNC